MALPPCEGNWEGTSDHPPLPEESEGGEYPKMERMEMDENSESIEAGVGGEAPEIGEEESFEAFQDVKIEG